MCTGKNIARSNKPKQALVTQPRQANPGGRGRQAFGNLLKLRFGEAQIIAQAQAVKLCLQPADLPRQLVTLQLLQHSKAS